MLSDIVTIVINSDVQLLDNVGAATGKHAARVVQLALSGDTESEKWNGNW